ncbi:MAG TPA: serine/threonine-protein kinase [Kofleriaceae bacterium]|nr:serine/threonine-protein kinase [Kofleriaceae bacterium]
MTTTQHDSIVPSEWYCPTCEQLFASGERCPTDGTRLVKVTPRTDPLLGRDLEGRYTIVEKLGEGGMGAVYRGTQHSVGREVAIKVITPSLVSHTEVIKRFLREAKLASRLSHPNAVGVLDFGQTSDGVFYLAMELVKGRTLDDVFRADGAFRPERVVRIGTQICDALAGAEALKIVHRDLKPSNIMVLDGTRDLIKVLDFGLAKSVAPDSAATTMTGSGALLGTPAFMPPELALGQPCDGRADLYSLGCILYLLASGRLPFTATNVHELIASHAGETPPPMINVPDALAQVIARLLEKDPAARYQTAAETQAALDAAIDIRAFQSQPNLRSGMRLGPDARTDALAATHIGTSPPTVSLSPRPPSRRRWPLAVAAALVVLAAVIGFVAIGSNAPTKPATPPPAAAPRIAPAVAPVPVDAAEAIAIDAAIDAGTPDAAVPPKPVRTVKHSRPPSTTTVDAGMPF